MKNKITWIMIVLLMIQIVFPANVLAKSKMPKGSVIGITSVGGKTESDISTAIQTDIALWQKDKDIVLKSENEYIVLPRSIFQFDVPQSIQNLHDKTKRSWVTLFRKKQNVLVGLSVGPNEADEALQEFREKDYIDHEATLANAFAVASKLGSDEVDIVYDESKEIPLETIVEAKVELPKVSNTVLTYAIEALDGTIIAPNAQFTLLDATAIPESISTSNHELNIVGTALYELFLRENFTIAERHAHTSLPKYAKIGTDVYVSNEEGKDFAVINDSPRSFRLEVEKADDTLYAALLAIPADKTYEMAEVDTKKVKQGTVYRYSPKLSYGEEELVTKGKAGIQTNIYRQEIIDGQKMKEEKISEEFYPPSPRVVLLSTQAEEVIVEENEEESETNDDGEFIDSDMDVAPDESLPETGETPAPNIPDDIVETEETIQKQLEILEAKQKELEKAIIQLADVFDIFYKDKHHPLEKEVQKKFDILQEQIEEILKQMAVDEAGDEDEDTKETNR